MKVCIIGDGLVSLTLANVLIQKDIFVDILIKNKNIQYDQSRTLGISKSNIELIGELDAVLTSTKFLIYPFVGLIKTKSKFVLSSEVQKMLFVPINELNNQINWRYEYIFNENSLKNYKSFHYDGNIIFGATAKIINNLLNILNKQS